MVLSPRLRKLVLTAHIISSVGWFGAVAAYLPLAIVGLTSQDALTMRAAYLAMAVIAWYVIVPFSIAALIVGVVQSIGTEWGLFRHYWVLVKFLLTVGGVIVLLLHMQPISQLADAATQSTISSPDLHQMRLQQVVASAGALVVLLVATVLSVFKPRGLTKYGWRRQQEQRIGVQP